MKDYKCPICGCTEHYQVPFVKELHGGGDYGYSYSVSKTLMFNKHKNNVVETYRGIICGECSDGKYTTTYLCKGCGHVDLFAEALLKKIKADDATYTEEVEKLSEEVSELTKKVEQLRKEEEKLLTRCEELGQLIKSEDITIRQQKEYKEELTKCGDKYHELKFKIGDLECGPLDKKKTELERAIYRRDNVCSIESVENPNQRYNRK